ncbi:MAG: SRPBCC family protein [Patescibacteria group bacterium]
MTISPITIEASVNAPVEKVWEMYTKPEFVTKWNQASPDWHCPKGENDMRVGGKFSYRMEAKDGSFGFDFGGVYSEVTPLQSFAYEMGDGRKVAVTFAKVENGTKVTTTFDPETENSVELQRQGWQSILDNFKKFAEAN